jgi:hypothetical protein
VRSFAEPPQEMLLPIPRVPHGTMVLLAQTAGDSTTLLSPLRDMVRALDPDVPARRPDDGDVLRPRVSRPSAASSIVWWAAWA